ncbi:MAG: hypothetical protein LBB04_03475 [Oscillospiraceae bacterium]|nr:hypothetical protein [Oscillospiraceae bacterium]
MYVRPTGNPAGDFVDCATKQNRPVLSKGRAKIYLIPLDEKEKTAPAFAKFIAALQAKTVYRLRKPWEGLEWEKERQKAQRASEEKEPEEESDGAQESWRQQSSDWKERRAKDEERRRREETERKERRAKDDERWSNFWSDWDKRKAASDERWSNFWSDWDKRKAAADERWRQLDSDRKELYKEEDEDDDEYEEDDDDDETSHSGWQDPFEGARCSVDRVSDENRTKCPWIAEPKTSYPLG